MVTVADASIILERAMHRLENAKKQEREAERMNLTAKAIVLNMSENLLDLQWDANLQAIQVTTKKFLTKRH